jgi:GntR family transcriptional repressor for pyruvate dehydrogenase complex
MSAPISQDELSRDLTRRYIVGDESVNSLMPSARILAEEYGVSRLFLREVLAGLQRQGLIETVPGRGVFVRKPHMLDAARNVHTTLRQSAATGHNLIEARANLEQETARLAALRATDIDIQQLEIALLAFDNATELLARAEADIAFHGLLAKATQNPVLQVMFGSITTLTFEIMLRSLADPETVAKGAPLHHTILNAVKNREPEVAMNAMSQHLHIAEDTFGPDLEIPLSEVAARIVSDVLGDSRTIHEVLDQALKKYSMDILR